MRFCKVRDSIRSTSRVSLFMKLTILSLMIGLGALVYYDYGYIMNTRDDTSSEPEPAPAPTNTAQKSNGPHAILIGFRYCGASSVLEHMRYEGKIDVVANVDHHTDNKRLTFQQRRNKSALSEIGIERSQTYVYVEKVPRLVKKQSENVKIILGVCEPIERLIDEYRNKAVKRIGSKSVVPSFFDVVFEKDNITVNENSEWVKQGCYGDYLKPWLRVFNDTENDFCIINGNHFRKGYEESRSVLEKVLECIKYDKLEAGMLLEKYKLEQAKLAYVTKPEKPPRPQLSVAQIEALNGYFDGCLKTMYKLLNIPVFENWKYVNKK